MKYFIFIILLISCKGHEKDPVLPMTTKECFNKIEGKYHSYFDSVEKCIENSSEKQQASK